MATVYAPAGLVARFRDPEREVCLPQYFYLAGDPTDEHGRQEVRASVPLVAGDFIRLRSPDGTSEVRRRVREVEFRLADLHGLGEIYVPCLVFDAVDLTAPVPEPDLHTE